MFMLEARQAGKPPILLALKAGKEHVLGRGEDCALCVPGEPFLSHRHAALKLSKNGLRVRRLKEGANPLFVQGLEKEEFELEPGQSFVVGATEFYFRPDNGNTSQPVPVALNGSKRDDRLRLRDLLDLPEVMRLKSRAEFHYHLATLLRLSCMGRFGGVASEDGTWLALDSSDEGAAKPGKADPELLRLALDAGGEGVYLSSGAVFWIGAALSLPGESPQLLAVSGSLPEDGAAWLHENARYVGLVADMVGRSLSLNKLQSWQERLTRYFSGPVVENILRNENPKGLEPRLSQATVMFFDIRGFSKRTEGRNEKILEYLGELRALMTAMTHEIFAENGVVLQYQGDGILACWNLPLPDPSHVDRACRAALAMVARLAKMPGDWSCGVGLHGGEVVAGAIGSEQLFNYSVMGSVVNQSSRVEGITKFVEVPILVTRAIADQLSQEVALPVRVGLFRPAGMATTLDLYCLQAPPGETERNEVFSQGLEAFERGDWDLAYERLSRLGATDRPARFLVSLSEEYRRHPPKDWDGVIKLDEK